MRPEKDATLAEIIGKNLKALREKRFPKRGGQGLFAKSLGVSQQTVNAWERGRTVPSDTMQAQIAAFFAISVGELRGDFDIPIVYLKNHVYATSPQSGIIEVLDLIAHFHEILAEASHSLARGESDPLETLHMIRRDFIGRLALFKLPPDQ